MTPEQRVELGKQVRFYLDMIQEEISIVGGDFKELFWQEFATEIKRRDLLQSEGESEKEFTDEQGKEFGMIECPFQKYKFVRYRAVPYDYLAFIVDSNKKLEQYLRWRWKKGMRE